MNDVTFQSLFDGIDENCPSVVSLFRLAETNRFTRWSLYGNGATLRGIDEALDYLKRAEIAFDEDQKLNPLQQLVSRTIAELETAIHAFFIGFHAVLFNAMRSAMEIEFLLRDFLLWPPHLSEWLNCSTRERYRKFKPAELRKRHDEWQRADSVDSQESRDYGLHSEYLHVSPRENPIGLPGLSSENHPAQLRACLAEITSHTGRLVTLVHRHWKGLPMNIPLTKETAPNLPLFEDACSRSRIGAAMWWPIM